MPTADQLEALDQIAAAAVASEIATQINGIGVPAALTTTQAIIESAWLTKAPGFNCFGVKMYPGCYGTQHLVTTEWFTQMQVTQFRELGADRTATLRLPTQRSGMGYLYDVQDLFATFPSLAACFEYHGRLLQQGRYATAWEAFAASEDLDGFIAAIAPIYATDPDYADRVTTLAHGPHVADAIARARSVGSKSAYLSPEVTKLWF
jgi:flagellum-specific peptidoglycan hydrolase FlgJ